VSFGLVKKGLVLGKLIKLLMAGKWRPSGKNAKIGRGKEKVKS
jgi:hypothetical protein